MTKYRILSVLLILILTAAVFPAAAFAVDQQFITKGTYPFSATNTDNVQLKDSFVFDEECFRESSFKGCTHLRLLSVQASQCSTIWYGPDIDHYGVDPTKGDHNIKIMLKRMGFTGVKSNAYYRMEALPDSFGVALGMRTISVKGKQYTLIAVIPRSNGYRQEWAGNFEVGRGNIHQGFKAARDETLRFIKKYIADQKITGRLKVWLAGHSRGGAIVNMTAAFLAGGGAGYLGSKVTLTPENIYCYSTATPRGIKNGTSKQVELSVEGARGGIYKNDTPGKAFVYSGEGTVDVNDPAYGGIRYYQADHDMVTMLPPEKWGFECYGIRGALDEGGKVTAAEMSDQLKKLNEIAYNMYSNGNCIDDFRWKTVDIQSMKIIDDKNAPSDITPVEFLQQRVTGLIENAKTNEEYVDGGYQDSLMALGAMCGMLERTISVNMSTKMLPMIRTLLATYNAYLHEMEQGGQYVSDSVSDTADSKVRDLVDDIMTAACNRARIKYGEAFYNEVKVYLDQLDTNTTQARRLITYALFYTDGEDYTNKAGMRNAVTLLSNVGIFMMTHYNEHYIAWAKAADLVSSDKHDTGEAEYWRSVQKKVQKISVSVTKKKVKASSLRKTSKVISAVKVRKTPGKITFKKAGGSNNLKINKKTGKITIRRSTIKGKYLIKIKIKAAATPKYRAASKTIRTTIIVK